MKSPLTKHLGQFKNYFQSTFAKNSIQELKFFMVSFSEIDSNWRVTDIYWNIFHLPSDCYVNYKHRKLWKHIDETWNPKLWGQYGVSHLGLTPAEDKSWILKGYCDLAEGRTGALTSSRSLFQCLRDLS